MNKSLGILLALALCLCGCASQEPDGFGILVGASASTDGCVYLAHNTYLDGEQMLNIYNVPPSGDRSKYLWFEFPGESVDSYMNEYGVCLATVGRRSESRSALGKTLYKLLTAAIQKAGSAGDAVKVIEDLANEYGYVSPGRSFLVADQREGWVCSLSKKELFANRVPDYGVVTVSYSRGKALVEQVDSVRISEIAGKPARKLHRRDLSLYFSMPPVRNEKTALTQVFALDQRFSPMKGSIVWVGLPNQFAANQSPWTVGTESPVVCHRFASADEALEKHFSDVGNWRERYPNHFVWHYVDPSIDMDVVPHDYVVYVPKQPRNESERDFSAIGDTFNDHFQVLDDPARGMLFAFWTQGSHEACEDEHIAFAKSADGGKTWTEPILLAGSHDRVNPVPVAGWQQPMLSKSGRLYCLWNQETTVKQHLCGMMYGRYSDDMGETWSDPELVPFPMRADSDPADPSIPPSWCNWQRPLRLGENGKYIVGCSRHGQAPYDEMPGCKVEFWQFENIDEDPEVKDIRISFFSTGRQSFDATKVITDENYVPREGPAIEEASIVGLPDGRLFAVMRSSLGHPVWSQSRDNGKTWTVPKVLLDRDGGTAFRHPRSPCPIYDLGGPEARSGRYFALIHNTFDFNGITAYQNRGPLYKIEGTFMPDAEQPIWFSSPELFSPRDTGNSFYTSYTSLNGEGVLWFNDYKFYLFGRIMNPARP